VENTATGTTNSDTPAAATTSIILLLLQVLVQQCNTTTSCVDSSKVATAGVAEQLLTAQAHTCSAAVAASAGVYAHSSISSSAIEVEVKHRRENLCS
jgi:hypothetical protein